MRVSKLWWTIPTGIVLGCLLYVLGGLAFNYIADAANPTSVVITTSTVAVNSTTTALLTADPLRAFILLQNDSDTNIYCKFGAAATTHAGFLLIANGGGILLDTTVSQQAVNCITLSGNSKNVLVNVGK